MGARSNASTDAVIERLPLLGLRERDAEAADDPTRSSSRSRRNTMIAIATVVVVVAGCILAVTTIGTGRDIDRHHVSHSASDSPSSTGSGVAATALGEIDAALSGTAAATTGTTIEDVAAAVVDGLIESKVYGSSFDGYGRDRAASASNGDRRGSAGRGGREAEGTDATGSDGALGHTYVDVNFDSSSYGISEGRRGGYDRTMVSSYTLASGEQEGFRVDKPLPQKYRTVTVPVPTKVRIPVEDFTARANDAIDGVGTRDGTEKSTVNDIGDLFGLGTGYTYFVKPGDWVYPPRFEVKLPEGAWGDMELLARGRNEGIVNTATGGLILRVNGREQPLKTVVQNGDVIELDAQANNIEGDMRVIVVRYMWRGTGAGGVRMQRRGLIRLNTKHDAVGETQPHRWPIVEHPDDGSRKVAPARFSSQTQVPGPKYVPGRIPQYVPVVVNIYGDNDDDDGTGGSRRDRRGGSNNRSPARTPSSSRDSSSDSDSRQTPGLPGTSPSNSSPTTPLSDLPLDVQSLLSAEVTVIPLPVDTVIGIPKQNVFVVRGLPEFDSDNKHHKELLNFRFGWLDPTPSGQYVEPPIIDSSTSPPDWIEVRVNGQLRTLPYAVGNDDKILLRLRSPLQAGASRMCEVIVGDLRVKVVLTTCAVQAPPSLNQVMNAHEPPAPPMLSPPPPREWISPPPPSPPLDQAPPSPPMPPAPNNQDVDQDGSYYDDAPPGSGDDSPDKDGSYYDAAPPADPDTKGDTDTAGQDEPESAPPNGQDLFEPTSGTPPQSLPDTTEYDDDLYSAYSEPPPAIDENTVPPPPPEIKAYDPPSPPPIPAPPSPPPTSPPPAPPNPSPPPPTTRTVSALPGTKVQMFNQSIVVHVHPQPDSTAVASVDLKWLFMEGDVTYTDALPSWAYLTINGKPFTPSGDASTKLYDGDVIDGMIVASNVLDMKRVGFVSIAGEQQVMEVITKSPPPPPPSPDSPPAPPEITLLETIAANKPRACDAAEEYAWSRLVAADRSTVEPNSWCTRSLPSGGVFNAPLCSSTQGRDIVIVVDASHSMGEDLFYGAMIDMLHDLYCTLEGSENQVALVLLPGSSNPFVCDSYTTYIPLQRHTADDFHYYLEILREDKEACCGRSIPLAQGLKAAKGLLEDYGEYSPSDASVIVITAGEPSTPIQEETCSFLSLPEYKELTRNFPYNQVDGSDMTSCHYKLRSVPAAAAELKLTGARVSVLTVPGSNGENPPSAYFSGSPWGGECTSDGECNFNAPYGGERGYWGEWYTDSEGETTRDYEPGDPLACDMKMIPGAPIASKPVLANSFRVNSWDAEDYSSSLAVAACPAPQCLPSNLQNATALDMCSGDDDSDWYKTAHCLNQNIFAACDRFMKRTEDCYGNATATMFQHGSVDGVPALATTITCRHQCNGVLTENASAKYIRVVCANGVRCDSEEIDQAVAEPATQPRQPSNATTAVK